MSTGCQKDRQRDRQTARQIDTQTERKTDRKTKKDRKIFQLTHQNKSCSECQLDVRKIGRQKYRQTDRQKD